MVGALREPGAGPWPVWVSFGTPCTGVFLPVYIDGLLPACLARGGSEARIDSAWWTFKALQDAALGDPARNTALLRERWAPFVARLDEARREVEQSARKAAAARDDARARGLLSHFMDAWTQEAMGLARRLQAELS